MKEKGFTLIELLVVIAIIGILAAIAIPQFAEYRQRGFDARARSDLRNAATAEEAYFVDNETYVPCGSATCPGLLPGFKGMSDAQVVMDITGDAVAFVGTSSHPKGTAGLTYTWNSATGGFVN